MGESFYLIVLLVGLFVPGALVLRSIPSKVEFNRGAYFPLMVALSLSVFTIILGFSQLLSLNTSLFKVSYSAVLVVSIAALLIKDLKPSLNGLKLRDAIYEHFSSLVLILLVVVYHLTVGPYDEVPTDIYQHLYYYQISIEQLGSASFNQIDLFEWLRQKGLIWYSFLAYFSTITDLAPQEVVYLTTLVTKTVFILSVYHFSQYIFRGYQHTKLIAFIATLFLALHMGINVFAYLRYYSFAPTMLSMVMFYSALILVMKYFESADGLINDFLLLFLIVFIGVSVSAIHTQEALFIIVMLACLTAVYAFLPGFESLSKRKVARIGFFLFLIASVIFYLLIHENLDAAPNNNWRLWNFGETGIPYMPTLYTLNLKFQFIRVVTLWGVCVLFLSIFFWKYWKGNAFLIAGVFTPFFTILNPFFIDIFLRLYGSTTIWRLTYLIPIYFLGAYIFVLISKGVISNVVLLKKIVYAVTALAMIVLLLPLSHNFGGLHYDRFATLDKVEQGNSYRYMADVIEALERAAPVEKKIILTDPVTGYVISGMTRHFSYRGKFFRKNYYHFTFETYEDSPLRPHKGKLLLVNKRSGAESDVGRIAKHWPSDILKLNQHYYPESLTSHLASKPNRFKLLWSSETQDILLYEIL